MASGKYVTLLIVSEESDRKYGLRLRRWVARGLLVAVALLFATVLIVVVFYGAVVERAARTENLVRENERLKRYSHKIQLLEQQLVESRQVVTRLAALAGIKYEFPEFPPDSVLFAGLDSVAAANAHKVGLVGTLPEGFPVAAHDSLIPIFDSLGHLAGFEIDCSNGTPVVATGSGMVERAEFDQSFGYLVVIRHNDSVTSWYGYNEKLLVAAGQPIKVGTRLALSGRSGSSSLRPAPFSYDSDTVPLHEENPPRVGIPRVYYAVRVGQQLIDPTEEWYAKEAHLK